MGYFNIFYKITRIIDMLTRKRNRRAIMVILIIIAVIFILHNKGYCAQEDTTYTTDTSYFILEEYNNLCDYFTLSFNKYYNKPSYDRVTAVFNTLFDSIQNGNYLYLYSVNGVTGGNVRLLTYNRNTSKTYVNTSLVYNDGTRVPSTAYNYTWLSGNRFYWIDVGTANDYAYNIYESTPSNDFNFTIPLVLLFKVPTQIIDCMVRAGYSFENNQDIIDIKALLQEQNQKLDTINDSLTNTTYDENVVDFDTDSVDNVDDTEITGLFTGVIGSFSNALNTYGGTITKIIPLPHGRTNRNTK